MYDCSKTRRGGWSFFLTSDNFCDCGDFADWICEKQVYTRGSVAIDKLIIQLQNQPLPNGWWGGDLVGIETEGSLVFVEQEIRKAIGRVKEITSYSLNIFENNGKLEVLLDMSIENEGDKSLLVTP